MKIITNGFWHNGIQFDNELEARWSIAFDCYGIEWNKLLHSHESWTYYRPNFWLPQVNMYACVYGQAPTKSEIYDLQDFVTSTRTPVLLLIGVPSNSAYFAVEPPEDGFETPMVIRGRQIYAADYVPLDHGYHISEGRFYFSSGADLCDFPSPTPLGDDDNCYGIHAINAANNYVFPSKTGAPLPAPHPGAKDFGAWVLSGDQLVLRTDETRAVDLESCNCSAQILDWIFHYRDRLTHQEMADLLQAFESILHPRQNYCGDGVDKGADPLLLLDQWLNPKPRRKPIKPSVRFQVLKRDDYRCQMCGATAKDGATLEIDHITPVSKGGSNDPENLQVLCRDCNAGKSDHLL